MTGTSQCIAAVRIHMLFFDGIIIHFINIKYIYKYVSYKKNCMNCVLKRFHFHEIRASIVLVCRVASTQHPFFAPNIHVSPMINDLQHSFFFLLQIAMEKNLHSHLAAADPTFCTSIHYYRYYSLLLHR